MWRSQGIRVKCGCQKFHDYLPYFLLGVTFDLPLRDLMGVSSEFSFYSIRFANLWGYAAFVPAHLA
jgi:hypothetical protein